MADFIEKDKNGFYVFNEDKFFKGLPQGLHYFAVDEANAKVCSLGVDAFKYYKKELGYRDKRLENQRLEINRLQFELKCIKRFINSLTPELKRCVHRLEEYEKERK